MLHISVVMGLRRGELEATILGFGMCGLQP